ncbi:MAG: DUF4230 domain-containing protein [Patescibacteria group bacterium]|nr:DUF4230 domain-containing protein [Patescibacteria group bacterium]
MGTIRKTLLTLGFAALAIAVLLFVGNSIFRGGDKVDVTSQAILERISDNYFVVTKSAFVDEMTEITIDKGSSWSNFFWGQTLTARGRVRIDIGVDLSGITEDDIVIDHANKTVVIAVPQAEILDASQHGNIEVESKQGILKTLLDSDPNDDHNRALAQLITEAKVAVSEDTSLFVEARNDSTRILELIVQSFGYTLAVPE